MNPQIQRVHTEHPCRNTRLEDGCRRFRARLQFRNITADGPYFPLHKGYPYRRRVCLIWMNSEALRGFLRIRAPCPYHDPRSYSLSVPMTISDFSNTCSAALCTGRIRVPSISRSRGPSRIAPRKAPHLRYDNSRQVPLW